MSPEVVVLGDATVDIVARLESYPPHGGDAQPLETRINIGGTSLNTAVMLARLGIETALVARVGPDFLGDLVLTQLAQQGLAARWMQRDPVITTGLVYIAVTPDGQRTMLGGAGANRNLSANDETLGLIRGARWLHLTSYNVLADTPLDASVRAIEAARAAGVTTSLDIGVAPLRLAPETLRQVAAMVDLLLPSEDSGDFDGTTQAVVRKLGGDGCVVTLVGDEFAVPALHIAVVDSTGAGDAFDAGYIAGRVRGLDWRASALLGNACGAAACTVLGAGDALPTTQTVYALLRERTPVGWEDATRRVLEIFAA